jgi:hypothetical protein
MLPPRRFSKRDEAALEVPYSDPGPLEAGPDLG